MVEEALRSAVENVRAAVARPGHAIYACDVWFAVTVHVMPALGFTRYMPCKWVIAASSDEAAVLARAHYEDLGIAVERVQARPALAQNVEAYVFPEQLLFRV